jgi:hypothetical protein
MIEIFTSKRDARARTASTVCRGLSRFPDRAFSNHASFSFCQK